MGANSNRTREMKLWSSLLASAATAQYADEANRWGGYEVFGGFNYDNGGKNDGGLAYGTLEKDLAAGENHFNGLYCWMCDERLNLGQETETTTDHAYTRCLRRGAMMPCKGEQRTCMFEERRRNGVIYSVCTGCKQTDACLALWRRNQRFTLPFMNFGDMSTEFHQDGKPIYVDDECTTYENSVDSSDSDAQAAIAAGGNGNALSYAKFSFDSESTDVQANSQMSQWESSCRWCCAATTTGACNLAYSATDEWVSPFNSQGCSKISTISAISDLEGANPVVRGATC